MPELPECEASRLGIEEAALNRTIERVEPGNDIGHVELPDAPERERLVGRQFTEARRHGKYIFAGSAMGPWIAVHLGMTGSIRPNDEGDCAPDFARLTILSEGGRRLAFRCPRKVGQVKVICDPDDFTSETGLEPDALGVGTTAYGERVDTTRGAVNSALMAQNKMAGTGNLWSGEARFQVGIRPENRAADLATDRVDALHCSIGSVFDGVLGVRARYSRLAGDWLIHHRERGDPCRSCDGGIAKATLGGRTKNYFDSRMAAA